MTYKIKKYTYIEKIDFIIKATIKSQSTFCIWKELMYLQSCPEDYYILGKITVWKLIDVSNKRLFVERKIKV